MKQAKQKSNVEEKKKAAALSLSTAEELKAKKKSRSSQFKNYILKGRPITLSTLPKQSQNIQELKEQEHKQSCLKEKRNARLQQVQLAEELARQKVRELKMKKENDKKHQKTLDHQPELPHPRVPTRRPVYNGSVVGVRPVTTTGVRAEVKQKVQRIHSENLKPVKTVKKYEVPSVKLTEQNKETETLQPNLMGFTAEQLAGLKLQSWQYDAKMRLIRDPEEEAFIRFSDELLLEQSQKYRSCYQRLIDSNIKN
ncbi:coiled-coil domain-containing protein 81-like [Trichomycterus rosablanca]|uniref:coiled-coil domain-containing protein 81-like n=1 Tax=Trichomycterus rosablanca TaxID=2290929 RepID=UPI002F3531B3